MCDEVWSLTQKLLIFSESNFAKNPTHVLSDTFSSQINSVYIYNVYFLT